jgi:hypothetical protein
MPDQDMRSSSQRAGLSQVVRLYRHHTMVLWHLPIYRVISRAATPILSSSWRIVSRLRRHHASIASSIASRRSRTISNGLISKRVLYYLMMMKNLYYQYSKQDTIEILRDSSSCRPLASADHEYFSYISHSHWIEILRNISNSSAASRVNNKEIRSFSEISFAF